MEKLTTEHQEQTKLVQWLNLKKIFHFAIPNANALSSQNKKMAIHVASKLKAEGSIRGASDIVVLLEKKILFIEMKKQPKKLKSGKLSTANSKTSDEQLEFIKNVNGFGYAVGTVCYGFNQAKEFIEGHLPKREINVNQKELF